MAENKKEIERAGRHTREKVDIVELNARLEKIVAHENELRTQIDAIIKEL